MIANLKSNLLRLSAVAATATALSLPAPAARAQDVFIGTIQAFGFNFCPRGWSTTAGQLLPIASNSALFSLLGTQYGGDGRTTFGLPDLRGRSMVSVGTGAGLPAVTMGQKGGNTEFALTSANQLPSHNHRINVTSSIANQEGPANDILGAASTNTTSKDIYTYSNADSNSMMRENAMSMTGASQAVPHRSPFQGVNICIALQGIYPSRN